MKRTLHARLWLVAGAAIALAACRGDSARPEAHRFWAGAETVEIARAAAVRGPWRQDQSNFDYVDDPAVAIAGDGRVAAAWVDQARRSVHVRVIATAGPAQQAAAVPVPGVSGAFSWMPRILFAPDDGRTVHLLWQEIVFSGGGHGGEILYARSRDGGASFGPAINLSNSLGGDGKGRLTPERWDNGSLDLVAGPGGRLYAAWTEYEGRLLVSRSMDGGATFSAPLHVAGDNDRPARAPSLALDRAGAVHLAWREGETPQGTIRIATSRDGGQSFGPAREPGLWANADVPRIGADAAGNLHLVFSDGPPGRRGGTRVRYARLAAGDTHFSPAVTIGAASRGVAGVGFPDLALDRAGHLYVVWKTYPDRHGASRGLGFTQSRDAGRSFSKVETLSGNAPGGGLQGGLSRRLAADGGRVVLADSTFREGEASLVRLWRQQVGCATGGAPGGAQAGCRQAMD